MLEIETNENNRLVSRREESETRAFREIVSLLERHAELRGVHAMADLVDDAVRWTV